MRIKEYRLKKGYTQEEVARLLGLDQAGYSRRENGKRSFNAEELLKLEIILGVSISELFKDKKMELEKQLNNK